MKIAIAGLGYVGLSLACLLAQNNKVSAVALREKKVDLVNNGISPLADSDIEQALASGSLNLHATVDAQAAYQDADLAIIATPTNYDIATDSFDTSSVESALAAIIECNPKAVVVLKSTVPIGYTDSIQKKYPGTTILFSPEFLREGKALYDNLHPSRIIVGVVEDTDLAREAAALVVASLLEGIPVDEHERKNPDGSVGIPTLITAASNAEAIKLMSNTYLALRIAYFNELDTFAKTKGLDAAQIIQGVCLDPRIGNHYNNPSFGYGGYCLPKDTRQALANYQGVPQNLIKAIVDSNATRKGFIVKQVLDLQPKTVGVHRLTMKNDSDNFRDSSIIDVMMELSEAGIDLLIYEPLLLAESFNGITVTHNLEDFKTRSDVIITNRHHHELNDCYNKVYTRDIWHRDS